MEISNCSIRNARAAAMGGAIYWDSSSGNVVISGLLIEDAVAGNESNGAGGGIYLNSSGPLRITGSTIQGATATSGGPLIDRVNTGTTVISNCSPNPPLADTTRDDAFYY